MAASTYFYGKAFVSVFNKEIDNSDTFKVALFTDAHTPAQDTDQYYDTLTNEVANGNGYTTGGITLSNVAFTYTAATNKFSMDADDVTWTNTSITARYAVIYDNTPGSNKPLIAYVDFGQNEATSAEDFKLIWNAAGIAEITVS